MKNKQVLALSFGAARQSEKTMMQEKEEGDCQSMLRNEIKRCKMMIKTSQVIMIGFVRIGL